jgi:hypothetical protein
VKSRRGVERPETGLQEVLYLQAVALFLKATPNGDKDAFRYRVQQLGNGAIVEKLISGRSFSDGRARGEGSKGYVVIRDAHIKSLAAASEVQSKVSECSTAKPQ